MSDTGSRLRDVRAQAGLTQWTLAEKVGLKQAQVSAIEVGRRTTTIAVLERWLEACGASLTIERPDTRDPRAVLLAELGDADVETVRQVVRIARAMKRLEADVREQETWMLEARAGLVERPSVREPTAAYRSKA